MRTLELGEMAEWLRRCLQALSCDWHWSNPREFESRSHHFGLLKFVYMPTTEMADF
jgi:hypothetical protein